MRYVAKVHVLDVLDQIVVSGYVYDADEMSSGDQAPTEFAFQHPGLGIDDPVRWLAKYLELAAREMARPSPRGIDEGRAEGAPHTVSETGDMGQNGVGWTVVGGAARG